MSDIVERLREPIDPDDPNLWKIDKDRREAAAEINRLRKELALQLMKNFGTGKYHDRHRHD
jgi:hypothetical protein